LHEKIATEVCNGLDAKLIRTLGNGAFKYAYLIERSGVPFALKIAHVSGNLRARFEREVAALSGCDHPSIAKIVASSSLTHAGHEYWVVVEEFLPGGTLSDLMQNGTVAPTEIRRIGLSLISALRHLFERGFVHRDIKPANILFRGELEPVLTDFGIVRVLGDVSLTQDFLAQGPGTPMYASPEQLNNEKCAIDWRTDQFGLALVLAELLLGQHAFLEDPKGNVRDAILRVAERRPLPEASRQRLTESGFAGLVKALAIWPVQRYRRPKDFERALAGEA
jgi:serine/threonine protein kinase